MTKTMTIWGAARKLEAIAAYAERVGMSGRIDIRKSVEAILANPASTATRDALAGAVLDLRATAGLYAPRTASWLDGRLFELLDYMDADVVELSGAELLDQLLADVPMAAAC